MRQRWTIALATILAVTTIAAGQDELTINRVPYRNVRITGMDDCQIVFEQGGRRIIEPLASVTFIQLDREDEFNQAETLMTEGKIDDALQKYRRARIDAEREWVEDLVELRRLWAMDQGGRIDEAVEMWLRELINHGATANARALIPTNLAEAGDEANTVAFDLLEAKRAEIDPNEDWDLWMAIADLQLRIAELEGDDENAQRIAQEILDAVSQSGDNDNGGTPDSSAVAARLRSVGVFVSDPEKASDVAEILTGDLYKYTDEQLPVALLLLGKAQVMLAEADDQDRTLLIDAGNNLMHVLIFFGDSDQAAEAYFLAAGVNEQLGNTQAARKAYRAIETDYADSPFAAEAKAALERPAPE